MLEDNVENGNVKDWPEPVISVSLKLQDFVKLDNGSAYLGFAQETNGVVNQMHIENWTFVSQVKSNS